MSCIFLCMPLMSALLFTTPFQIQDSQPISPTPPATGTQAQNHSQSDPAPQTNSSANRRIQDSIDDLLNSDLVLNGADVEASVDDRSIVLTGKVESYTQHQRVLELVAQYGRWRRIEDKIQMK